MSETPPPDHTTEILEELLEHTSQLSLSLGHVSHGLDEVKEQMGALRGEIAQHGETANAAFSAASAPKRSGPPTGPVSNDQLDTIERHARTTSTRVTVLTALVVVQTLLLGALVFLALKPAMSPMPEPAAAHAAPVAAPKPEPATIEKPIEQNPFAGAPDAPGAAKADADDDAKAESKPKKKKKK